jgi:tetratricopeptide (TPR) repeat protein
MGCQDQLSARNVKVQTYIEKIKMKAENTIAAGEGKDKETLLGIEINADTTTGFLFCLRCGLRKPNDMGSKYCPNCGAKLIEEGVLPYVPKSYSQREVDIKNKLKEGYLMERNESIYGIMQQNQLHKKNGLSRISAIEKADNGDYENAINELNEIIRLNPKDAISYFSRATLKVNMGDIEGAKQDFKMSEIFDQTSDLNLDNYPLV